MSGKIIHAWIPGLPHVLRPDLSGHYKNLATAASGVGEEFARLGVKRILYYSTQWLSVLGQSVQVRPHVKGLHVDENWYDIASLPFDFRVDQDMARKLVSESASAGFQVRGVDYEGFPVDTGTIVANSLINKSNLPTGMYSSCVYSDYQETVKIGQIARKVAESMDGVTAMVAVSGLSGRYFTTEIDYREDHIRDPKDHEWNQKLLRAMDQGDWTAVNSMRDAFSRECKADMGLKALAFLDGAGACASGKALKTKAYGAIYGTGAAVMLGTV